MAFTKLVCATGLKLKVVNSYIPHAHYNQIYIYYRNELEIESAQGLNHQYHSYDILVAQLISSLHPSK